MIVSKRTVSIVVFFCLISLFIIFFWHPAETESIREKYIVQFFSDLVSKKDNAQDESGDVSFDEKDITLNEADSGDKVGETVNQAGNDDGSIKQAGNDDGSTKEDDSIIPVTLNEIVMEDESTSPTRSSRLDELSPEIINDIKKFVFFAGTGRTGHSIVGSLLDAHPHIVIPDQFLLFLRWPEFGDTEDPNWTLKMFNALYTTSANDAIKRRTWSSKGYTLEVDGQWQGRFDQYIEVIGDKSGGVTTGEYWRNRTAFREKFKTLKKNLHIPIHIFHVIRNPFDILSTTLIYLTSKQDILHRDRFNHTSEFDKINDTEFLYKLIEKYFKRFRIVMEMIEEVFKNERVLVLHNSDLVRDPKGTMLETCNFLEVEATEDYLDSCANKVFKSVSHSRDKVVWDTTAIELAKKEMRKFSVFDRYSFTSD